MAGPTLSQQLAGFGNETFDPSYAPYTPAPSAPGYNPAAFGSIPSGTSPQGAQTSSIAGNLANVNQIATLASGIGGASGAGGAANLNAALPGATAALGSTLNLGLGEEAGQVPQSTINL